MDMTVPKQLRAAKGSFIAVPPSQRPRPRRVATPPGMIDVWRVSHHTTGDRWELAGFYKKEENAWVRADEIWKRGDSRGLRVEHKAGIDVNGKMYLVNVLPIKFKDEEPPCVNNSGGYDFTLDPPLLL